jgi:hypothetical protein
MKRVIGGPNIGSATRHETGLAGRIELRGAGFSGFPNVTLAFEWSQVTCQSPRLRDGHESENEWKRKPDDGGNGASRPQTARPEMTLAQMHSLLLLETSPGENPLF